MKIATLLLQPAEITAPGSIDAMVVNRGDEPLEYGLAYGIEHWDGERWQETDIAPDSFLAIAIIVRPGEIGQSNSVQIPTEVKPGFYRVTKSTVGAEPGTALELRALFQVR